MCVILQITIDHPEEHSDRVRPFTAPRLADSRYLIDINHPIRSLIKRQST